MEAWVLDLPIDTGQPLNSTFKAWRSRGQFKDVRWNLRKVLTACGYDMNMKNGGVKDRLASFKGPLGDMFGCLGMTLSPPHLGAPLMSIAQKRRKGEDYVDSCGDQAEQEWYVNTSACIALLIFMATHRKGEGCRWIVVLLLRKFISTFTRDTFWQARDLRNESEAIAEHCDEYDVAEGYCCHLSTAPIPGKLKPGQVSADSLASLLVWCGNNMKKCNFMKHWLISKIQELADEIEERNVSWGSSDLLRHPGAHCIEPGRKRRHRFDIHLRQQLASDERSDGLTMSSSRAWKVIHKEDLRKNLLDQERSWMLSARAMLIKLGRSVGCIGASFDETNVGTSPERSLNISMFFFSSFGVTAVGPPQVIVGPA